MGYSVRDFMVPLLLRWLYSEKYPAKKAKYAALAFVQLLMHAAQAKDYGESVSSLYSGLPKVHTLFWRLVECASFDLIVQKYKKIVERSIEAVKRRIRRRKFIVAFDETYEKFYGIEKNLWIYEYTNVVKGATGSYVFIVLSFVSGDLRHIFPAIPITKISMEKDYYVKEFLLSVQSLIPVKRRRIFLRHIFGSSRRTKLRALMG